MNQFLKRYSTIFNVIAVLWLACCAFSMIFEPTWFMQIPLLVLSTAMVVMNLTYSAVSKVFKEEAASQLEKMQLTLKLVEKLCENADYEQMDKLKETLGICSSSEECAKRGKEAARLMVEAIKNLESLDEGIAKELRACERGE